MTMLSRLSTRNLSVWYGDTQALKPVTMDFADRAVTALIGPSGCGKSTLLRSLNRLNELIPNTRASGQVMLDERNIYGSDYDLVELRRQVGMVFQKSNPFAKSIFDNVAYGLRIGGIRQRSELEARVDSALKRAGLWDEVKDRLNESAFGLSGGQQQRLCIARALAIAPEVLLLDEPASALDPIATAVVEELIRDLARDYTVVIVTHNLQEAARVASHTAFMYLGELVEYGPTEQIFHAASAERTRAYLSGHFG
jgi:phosphate transport system ATP-binding protein